MEQLKPKPQLLAWICCDHVHVDSSTGKYTLLGAFSAITSRKFPVRHPRMVWFLSLADVSHGEHRLRLSLHRDLDTPKVILEKVFFSEGPLKVLNLISEIQNMEFPQAGDYNVTVEVDDQTLLVNTLYLREQSEHG